MFIKTFPVGMFQCNCTIVADKESGDAFVFDPGAEGDKIVAELRKHQLHVKYIVHTHAHLDHIGATKEVHEKCGGDLCLHKGDMPLYENIEMQAKLLGIEMSSDVSPVTRFLEHKDVLECSVDIRTEVLFTPGHTPGSVCFMFEKLLLSEQQELPVLCSGDTLFQNSIGRTDLWGGDFKLIIESIREKLFKLPPETIVIPGHGPSTTIGYEIQYNPFLR